MVLMDQIASSIPQIARIVIEILRPKDGSELSIDRAALSMDPLFASLNNTSLSPTERFSKFCFKFRILRSIKRQFPTA